MNANNGIPGWAKFVYHDWQEDPLWGTVGLRVSCFAAAPMVLRGERWEIGNSGERVEVTYEKAVARFVPYFESV